jgi:hypothetical protein
MNEPPEEKYADVLEGGYRLSDPGEDEHYFIFNSIGPDRTTGEEIARIDMRDGTVTYRLPDAGRQAAEIFWIGFGDFIKKAIDRYKEENK